MSEAAVLNANYLLARLRAAYDLPFERLCMHEFVLSARNLKREHGVTALDVAKRLMDFGFHPPTIYFPLIVPEALMIEPTETEPKETLDAFADAMLRIAEEAASDPQVLKDAPHRRGGARARRARPARRRPARARGGGARLPGGGSPPGAGTRLVAADGAPGRGPGRGQRRRRTGRLGRRGRSRRGRRADRRSRCGPPRRPGAGGPRARSAFPPRGRDGARLGRERGPTRAGRG